MSNILHLFINFISHSAKGELSPLEHSQPVTVGSSHGHAIDRMLEGSGRTFCTNLFLSLTLFIRRFLLSSSTILISLNELLEDLVLSAVGNL